MRLLFVADSHIKGRNPESRIDNYPVSILRKFVEISIIASNPNNKVDAIIHGGDVFDIPRVTPDLVGQLAEIIKSSDRPWYIVPGNHDLYGHNVSTLSQTMLGLLDKTGVIKILSRENPHVLVDGMINVSLQGQEYYAEIDHGNPNDYDVEVDPSCNYHILAAHGMLLDTPFHPDIPHTLISNVKTNADLVLAGHYHPGFPVEIVGKTTFINPGSMSRTSCSPSDNRLPRFLILDIDSNGIRYKFREFATSLPADKVINFASKQLIKNAQNSLNQFGALLQGQFSTHQPTDINVVLDDIANDPNSGIDKQFVQDTIAFLAQVQISKDDAVPKLDGFVESINKIHITKIEANNFQCYKNLDVDLDKGLNVIHGESNSGKTSLMRLIRWVQSGEPRGSEMISHWGKSMWGKITYSDGYSITRERTRTSSGTCTITDPNGNITVLKGTNTLPVDVINVHQMPPIWLAKDEKRNMSYASQLETSFLVTESAGLRAAAIGRLIGLQNVDSAIRTLNANNRSINKEICIKEDLLNADRLRLGAYNDLPDLEDHILKIESNMFLAGVTKNSIEDVKSIMDSIYAIDTECSRIQSLLDAYSACMPTEEQYAMAEEQLNRVYALRSIEEIYSIDQQICNINEELSKISGVKNITNQFDIADRLQNYIKDADTIYGEIIDIDTNTTMISHSMHNMTSSYSTLTSMLDVASRQNDYVAGVSDLTERISRLDTEIIWNGNMLKNCTNNIQVIDDEIEHLISGGMCECPTCGSPISRELLIGGTSNG